MTAALPRLPLKATVDLTYRCNNSCRHCWLWLPAGAPEQDDELGTDEWRDVIDQARALGTHDWGISGGEPMLRPDFAEIFDYATSRAVRYSLNTNGTLITPEIARLLRRKGSKMVAVYGATAEVYDRVTRHPGGFEALVQGLSYLKEAGAGFMVQLIPMRENWHQWDEMVEFAWRWSRHYRDGAPWLYKTACGDAARNAEIERQRLDPADVAALDPVVEDNRKAAHGAAGCERGDDRLYADCIARRRDFHVDPYGRMGFCGFVKDDALWCDLRAEGGGIAPGAVRTVWEESIPAMADTVRGGREYREGCGSCELRESCRWCDVYGYLEHRRHGAKVDYLCDVARASRDYKERWVREHRRYYEIAGITLQVESDLPIGGETFQGKFADFRVDGPGADTVTLRHHFGLPENDGADGAVEVYRKAPWAIYRSGASWIYHGISPHEEDPSLHRVAVFSADHTRGTFYNNASAEETWRKGGIHALTMFPSDQILLARLVADRDGCFLHSGGLTIDGNGLLFVGHSEAGKSTTMGLVRDALGERVEILCDDRNIVRWWPRGYGGGHPGFYVHGTWSHGDVPDVSATGAPLRGIFFLEQSAVNEIVPLTDAKAVWSLLLGTLIKPMVTADWWRKEMDVLERIVGEVPCYTMRFDRSGAIVPRIVALSGSADAEPTA